MFKKKNYTLFFIVGVVCTLIIAGVVFLNKNFAPVSNDNSQIALKILPGDSFNMIVSQLKEKELIKNKLAFKILAILSGKAHQIKPGEYLLNRSLSSREIIKILVKGPEEIAVTIIPGKTLKEIDDLLSKNKIIQKGELINLDINTVYLTNPSKYFFLENKKTLEGFLLPDTYRFLTGESPKNVAFKILDNFLEKALPILEKDDKIEENREILYQDLILASCVEKEVPVFEDQKIAAGILKKRLEIGMPLQVDATVLYAKCDGRFNNCSSLRGSDLKIDSPYNTYLFKGLPPAPISNPAISTIEAVINSTDSPYLYYLSVPNTNITIFSKTLEEHNHNRLQYLSK
jgi:UPF0755 protein